MSDATSFDEPTLHVLRLVLKDLRRQDDLAVIYESLHKRDASNTDVLAALFHAYARSVRPALATATAVGARRAHLATEAPDPRGRLTGRRFCVHAGRGCTSNNSR